MSLKLGDAPLCCRLYLNADAGANLWLDGELVIDNSNAIKKDKERELVVSMKLSTGQHAREPRGGGARGRAGIHSRATLLTAPVLLRCLALPQCAWSGTTRRRMPWCSSPGPARRRTSPSRL